MSRNAWASLVAAVLFLSAASAMAEPLPPGEATQQQVPTDSVFVVEDPPVAPVVTAQVPPVPPLPTQEQPEEGGLRLSSQARYPMFDGQRPVRPGEDFELFLQLVNGSSRSEEFAVTITVPSEVTLADFTFFRTSGNGDPRAGCSGNVCRGSVAGVTPGGDDFQQNMASLVFRGRLSPTFPGTMSTVRADLNAEANAEPEFRSATTVVEVEQTAATVAPAASGRTSGGQSLAATGGTGLVGGFVAMLLLTLGAMTRAASRRPVSG